MAQDTVQANISGSAEVAVGIVEQRLVNSRVERQITNQEDKDNPAGRQYIRRPNQSRKQALSQSNSSYSRGPPMCRHKTVPWTSPRLFSRSTCQIARPSPIGCSRSGSAWQAPVALPEPLSRMQAYRAHTSPD